MELTKSSLQYLHLLQRCGRKGVSDCRTSAQTLPVPTPAPLPEEHKTRGTQNQRNTEPEEHRTRGTQNQRNTEPGEHRTRG